MQGVDVKLGTATVLFHHKGNRLYNETVTTEVQTEKEKENQGLDDIQPQKQVKVED